VMNFSNFVNHLIIRLRSRADRSRRLFAHSSVRGKPSIQLISQSAADRPQRLLIAQRLIEAYLSAKSDECNSKLQLPKNDLWTNLIEAEFKQLLQILDSKDAKALSQYLLHFGKEYTWFGGLTLSVDSFSRTRRTSSIAISYLDKLVCLAESLGVLQLENPEQSDEWGKNLYVDVNEILDNMEKEIGIPLALPNQPIHVTGIATSRGPLHYRHFNALYAALRIKSLLPNGGAICEYGGGLGLVAYYASRLGFTDYTIFDIPLVNVFAGHFLMNVHGVDSVCLYGENCGSTGLKVLPYWRCMDVPAGIYSLAINQDSFPEIDPALVTEYIRQIERTTTEYFLSINQEAQASMGSQNQNSVLEMFRNCNGFHKMYRMKCWTREGYVEELYRIRM